MLRPAKTEKYLFIPLDIFLKNKQNVDINVKRDAWLTLFSSDDPDDIIRLIEKYPEFRKIYEEGYQICMNIEGVMDMFSEELYELDRNTVDYMIDEMQETIDNLHDQLKSTHEQAIRNTVIILKELNLSDSEIIARICSQYQLDKEEVLKFL